MKQWPYTTKITADIRKISRKILSTIFLIRFMAGNDIQVKYRFILLEQIDNP